MINKMQYSYELNPKLGDKLAAHYLIFIYSHYFHYISNLVFLQYNGEMEKIISLLGDYRHNSFLNCNPKYHKCESVMNIEITRCI